MQSLPHSRRPLTTRSSPWAAKWAHRAARLGFTPNQISCLSVVFAAVGAVLILQGNAMCWWAAALCIQLRLLCNLLDGMVAVEGGRATPSGALFNELPDRVADCVLLIALGYVIRKPELGWAIALAAALTAYVRTFGGSLGLPQLFSGPMAKQHRMACLSAALLAAGVASWWDRPQAAWQVLHVSAWLILAGSLWTCVARTRGIVRQLHERPPQ